MQILLTFRSSRLLTHPLILAFRPNRQVDRICARVSVAVTRCLWSNYNHSLTYWPHTSVGANIDVGWTFTVSRDQRTPPDDRYPLTYRSCSVRVGSQKDRSGNLCHLKNVRLVVFSCLDLKIKDMLQACCYYSSHAFMENAWSHGSAHLCSPWLCRQRDFGSSTNACSLPKSHHSYVLIESWVVEKLALTGKEATYRKKY